LDRLGLRPARTWEEQISSGYTNWQFNGILDEGEKQMKNICRILIAALFLAIPFSLWSQNAPDGARLFKQRCASCHGEKGEGSPAIKMPAVNGISMTVEKLATYITKGESGRNIHLTPIVNINDAEAKAIAEHVKSLN
jgi:mono/diheme cytochrome c family protein